MPNNALQSTRAAGSNDKTGTRAFRPARLGADVIPTGDRASMGESSAISFLLAVAAIATMGVSPSVGSESLDSPIQQLLNADYHEVRAVTDLPITVRENVAASGGMADPGEDFNAGCIASDSLPDRRLVFAGESPGWSFIYYEEGQGRAGTHYFLDVYVTGEGFDGRLFTVELERSRKGRHPPLTFKKLAEALISGRFCVVRGIDSAVRGIPAENRCLDRWGGITTD